MKKILILLSFLMLAGCWNAWAKNIPDEVFQDDTYLMDILNEIQGLDKEPLDFDDDEFPFPIAQVEPSEETIDEHFACIFIRYEKCAHDGKICLMNIKEAKKELLIACFDMQLNCMIKAKETCQEKHPVEVI